MKLFFLLSSFFCSFIFAKLWFNSLTLARISFSSLLSFSAFLILCFFCRNFMSMFSFFLFHIFLLLFYSNFFSSSNSTSVKSFYCTAPSGGGEFWGFEKYPSNDFFEYSFLSFLSLNFRCKLFLISTPLFSTKLQMPG